MKEASVFYEAGGYMPQLAGNEMLLNCFDLLWSS